jgi:hypothetical protein
MRALDKLALFLVMAGLLAICALYYSMYTQVLSNEVVEVYGSGRVLGLVIMLTLYYFLLVNPIWTARNTRLVWLVAIWTVWTFLVSLQLLGEMDLVGWLSKTGLGCLCWPCVFFFFVQLGRKSGQAQLLNYSFLVITVFSCVGMYFVRESAMTSRGWHAQVFNAVYYPLLTLPWLLMLNKRILRYVAIALVLVAIFYSTKRTAMVAFALAMTSAIGCKLAVASTLRKRVQILHAAFVMLGVGGGAVVISDFSTTDQSQLIIGRLANTTEIDGGGRIMIYESYLQELTRMPFSVQLTGRGFDSGKLILVQSAHNDWLEALYDFGIIGLILYGSLHFLLLTRLVQLIRIKSSLAEPYGAAYMILLVMSMTSHLIIYPNYFTVLVAFFGTVEGSCCWRRGKPVGGVPQADRPAPAAATLQRAERCATGSINGAFLHPRTYPLFYARHASR